MSGTISKREQQVIQLIWDGRSSKEIATQLGIRTGTVSMYRARLARKLDATGFVVSLVRQALNRKLIFLP